MSRTNVAVTRLALLVSAILLTAACDGFTGSNPMDHVGETTLEFEQLLDHPTTLGVLALVNDEATTADFLDVGLELDVRAAERIVAHRQGPDGLDGTYDDDRFGTILELDEIPYVGEATLLILSDAAWELDYVPVLVLEGVPFTALQVEEVLLLGNEGTLYDLDEAAGLDVRAAEAIVAGRPYTTVSELAERPHVGGAALEAMQVHAAHWGE